MQPVHTAIRALDAHVVVRVNLREVVSVQDDLSLLIERIAEKRDREAFKRLFASIAPRLKGFFVRAGCAPTDADDLIQDVMFKVWSRAGQFDPNKASGATWIFTIARNRLVDRFRRTHRPEPDPEDPAFIRAITPLEMRVDRLLKGKTAVGILEELPPEQAEVVRRSYFLGHSLSDIASETNAPLGTIKTRARLAMKYLRARMAERLKGGEA
ncbi:MAG: sigma-70 family RNA polymerase sigma factor [Myxococcota bacterium]